jgi:membrane protein DedA with SNARE-associated domain
LSGPEEARPARTLVYAIPLGIMTLSSLIGSAFMPWFLARHPLRLVALSPLSRHLVLVAPTVDPASLFAVAVPRHFLPHPFVYFLGRQYGPLAVEWAETNSPFLGKLVRALERLFAKVGVLALLVSPDIIVSTLAGAARVPFPLFAAFNVAGTFVTVAVARWFGDVFDRQIHALVAFFQGHLGIVTAVSVLFVVVLNWYSRRGVTEE